MREDQLVIAEVKVTQRMSDDGESQGLRVTAENVYDLATMRRKRAKGLKLACNGNASAETLAEILHPIVPATRPSPSPIVTNESAGRWSCSPDWRVNLDDALLQRLREWLAPENVEVVY